MPKPCKVRAVPSGPTQVVAKGIRCFQLCSADRFHRKSTPKPLSVRSLCRVRETASRTRLRNSASPAKKGRREQNRAALFYIQKPLLTLNCLTCLSLGPAVILIVYVPPVILGLCRRGIGHDVELDVARNRHRVRDHRPTHRSAGHKAAWRAGLRFRLVPQFDLPRRAIRRNKTDHAARCDFWRSTGLKLIWSRWLW